jgi:hypothetical protein
VTVPSRLLATHTAPKPTATAAGKRPVGKLSASVFVAGSIRRTESWSESTAQKPPSPASYQIGMKPSFTFAVTLPVFGSSR